MFTGLSRYVIVWNMNISDRQQITRETFTTNLVERVLEPEEVISGDEGKMYAIRVDDRTLITKMLAFDIVESLGLTRDSRLLEVGCGSGQLAFELSKYIQPQNIVATDGSPELIESAKERYGKDGIVFEVENVHEIKDKANFDAVVCKDSLHHFPNPVVAIKELMAPLKIGGALYIFDLTRSALDSEIDQRQKDIINDHEAMRFLRSVNASLTIEEFEQAAKQAGESNLIILHPVIFSNKNREIHSAEIEANKNSEINLPTLSALYIIRKVS